MPQAYVEKLAKKHKMTVAAAEKHWSAAKKSAAKEGHEEDFAYVTGIFKKMMGEGAPTPNKNKPVRSTYWKAGMSSARLEADSKAKGDTFHSPKSGPFSLSNNPYAGDKEASAEFMDGYKAYHNTNESARDKVAKAVILVQEAKVQKKLKALKASTFMEFLINEAADNPGVGDFVKFDHDGEKVEGKIARIGKNDAGKKFYTTRIVDGSSKGKVVSVDAAKCS